MKEVTAKVAPARFEASLYFDNNLLEKRTGDDPAVLEVWMLSQAGLRGSNNGRIIDRCAGGKQVRAFRYSAPDS
ncbi:hypothetical protein [Microbulbifer marinus]|uniref:Uncharacterized protein n=1 Tax=Microbulbifer marinus TaxID=658218 RepID=A0A1H4BCZ7_9GAMM|nr:hypothetical protein [Microbulbifer marinus]SEA46000.1 hypothetical protein SAMN05216562_3217 [Microbulbifer marinus]